MEIRQYISEAHIPEIKGAMTYKDYYDKVQELASLSATSGVDQDPERVEATKLNAFRMKRIEKQIQLHPALLKHLAELKEKWLWIVLIESWCGDGAQNVPIIARMAKANEGKIDLQLVFRDENTELINAHLTGGAQAIPKLICYSLDRHLELGEWGPRPVAIQEKVKILKQNTILNHQEFVKAIQALYVGDKGESLQNEFEKIIAGWVGL